MSHYIQHLVQVTDSDVTLEINIKGLQLTRNLKQCGSIAYSVFIDIPNVLSILGMLGYHPHVDFDPALLKIRETEILNSEICDDDDKNERSSTDSTTDHQIVEPELSDTNTIDINQINNPSHKLDKNHDRQNPNDLVERESSMITSKVDNNSLGITDDTDTGLGRYSQNIHTKNTHTRLNKRTHTNKPKQSTIFTDNNNDDSCESFDHTENSHSSGTSEENTNKSPHSTSNDDTDDDYMVAMNDDNSNSEPADPGLMPNRATGYMVRDYVNGKEMDVVDSQGLTDTSNAAGESDPYTWIKSNEDVTIPNGKTPTVEQLKKIRKKRQKITRMKAHAIEGLYKCDICGAAYKNDRELKRHMTCHLTNDQQFTCPYCDYTTNVLERIRIHVRTHTGDRPHRCDLCPARFADRSGLMRHKRIHSGERPYKCKLCDRAYRQTGGLKLHMRTHTNPGAKDFTCPECGATFAQISGVRLHLDTVHGTKDYMCSECGSAFTQLRGLQQHQLRIHSTEKPYKCTVEGCTYSGKSKYLLKDHLKRHSGVKSFQCATCGKSFIERNGLKRHMKIHSGVKQFKCTECAYGTNDRPHLIIHNRVHTGEKPFVCHLCRAAFISKPALNTHMKVHVHPKVFRCVHCTYRCDDAETLAVHMIVHNGGKPYECVHCDFTCKNLYGLNRHTKRRHGAGRKDVSQLTGTEDTPLRQSLDT